MSTEVQIVKGKAVDPKEFRKIADASCKKLAVALDTDTGYINKTPLQKIEELTIDYIKRHSQAERMNQNE